MHLEVGEEEVGRMAHVEVEAVVQNVVEQQVVLPEVDR